MTRADDDVSAVGSLCPILSKISGTPAQRLLMCCSIVIASKPVWPRLLFVLHCCPYLQHCCWAESAQSPPCTKSKMLNQCRQPSHVKFMLQWLQCNVTIWRSASHCTYLYASCASSTMTCMISHSTFSVIFFCG